MKRKSIFLVIGLLLAFVSFIPVLPTAIKTALTLIPIIFFGLDLLFSYLKLAFKKEFINDFLAALIGSVGLICTGKLTYAAITMIFFSGAEYFFESVYKKANSRIEEACRILPGSAMQIDQQGSIRRIRPTDLKPSQNVAIKEGDIVPADGVVISGEGVIDYTNLFGPSEPADAKPGSKCYSGGIVQSGKIVLQCQRTASHAFAYVLSQKTKKAHSISPRHAKIQRAARIYQPCVMAAAIIMFIVLSIVTKDYSRSMNTAVVILFASPALCMTKALSMLYHNSILGARRRGAVFASEEALEKFSVIQTLSPNEPVSPELLGKIEETGIIPAKNGTEPVDAVLYRSEDALERDPHNSYKVALGFFSKNTGLTITDANTERIVGAIRTAHDFRSIMWQNIACVIIEKLALIALAFLLNITPAAAVVIEFAAWMLCLLNASRDNN